MLTAKAALAGAQRMGGCGGGASVGQSGRAAVASALVDHHWLAPQKIALDGLQMAEHCLTRAVAVARDKRVKDRLVLCAIGAAPLLRERALLHLEPQRLVAQHAHQIVDLF